jgi:MSHA biogenesis protein MshJ
MNAVRQQWEQLAGRYAAMSRREKLLVATALIVVPLLAGEMLILEGQRTRNATLAGSIEQQSASATEMQTQVLLLQQQLQVDPDARAKAEIAALMAEQQMLEKDLLAVGQSLVPPEQMNELLEQLLARHRGLRLVSLKTMKPQSVMGEPEKDGAAAAAPRKEQVADQRFDLYRHGVEIRIEGSFAELQAYLVQLEELKERLLWGYLQYEVGEYPKAEMSLMVYTLSADRTWLAL